MTLSKQHVINSPLNKHYSKKTTPHYIITSHPTPKQLLKVKSPIVNTNNHLNEVFPSFDSLNKELSSGFHLVDTFSDHFSFYSVNRKDADAKLHIITNLIISTRTLSLIKTQFLLFWMLVLKKCYHFGLTYS